MSLPCCITEYTPRFFGRKVGNSVPRLHGRQLVVAQAVTLVAIGLAVLIYIAGLASMYTLFLGAF
jgi:hypothetical protein